MAIKAWVLMDRQLDWTALPVVCELLGVRDPAALVNQLVVMRDFSREPA